MPPTPKPRDREPGRAVAFRRIVSAMAVAMAAGVVIIPAAGVAKAQAPGLETFAVPPQTPIELWDAISYLTRVGRTDQAIPLLERFMQANPDDDTLLEIRDRFGLGSILRLQDDPRTISYVPQLLDLLKAASQRQIQRPDRIQRAVTLLSGTPLQQDLAIRLLNESGPYAVPILIDAIEQHATGTPERALLVGNLGRLDRKVVPALIAALDSPDSALAADAASALGRIGDRRRPPVSGRSDNQHD